MADEAGVLKRVKNILKAHDKCIALRITAPIGLPDFVACVGGRFMAIEVKDDKNGSYGLTAAQKKRLNKFVEIGAIGACVDRNNITCLYAMLSSVVADPSVKITHWGYTPDVAKGADNEAGASRTVTKPPCGFSG